MSLYLQNGLLRGAASQRACMSLFCRGHRHPYHGAGQDTCSPACARRRKRRGDAPETLNALSGLLSKKGCGMVPMLPALCCTLKGTKLDARVSRALRARNEQPRQQAAVQNAGQVPTGNVGIDLAASGGAGALQKLACAPQMGITSLARLEMERWGPGSSTSAAVFGDGAGR